MFYLKNKMLQLKIWGPHGPLLGKVGGPMGPHRPQRRAGGRDRSRKPRQYDIFYINFYKNQ